MRLVSRHASSRPRRGSVSTCWARWRRQCCRSPCSGGLPRDRPPPREYPSPWCFRSREQRRGVGVLSVTPEPPFRRGCDYLAPVLAPRPFKDERRRGELERRPGATESEEFHVFAFCERHCYELTCPRGARLSPPR